MIEPFFGTHYWLTRLLLQKGIAFVYLIAFLVAVSQFRPLLGERGLLPTPTFLQYAPFRQTPSIFHIYYSDGFFSVVAWLGVILSLVALLGFSEKGPLWTSMTVWFLLWLLYLSIVNVGQTFYAFGWESMLLEAGFLTIFLGPSKTAVPLLVVFLLRFMLFRVEFGAGLIKLRGDSCWRDLTCLIFHHETQPMPNPLSWSFHHLPTSFHKLETLGNFVVQLIAPWGLFLPQPIAAISGSVIILSQLWLMVSGNYSFLNLATIVLAFTSFNTAQLQKILPLATPATLVSPPLHQGLVVALTLLIAVLSIWPVKNMFSRRQLMNASFNPLHLVNTYGAFGTVTKERYEVVVEGTDEPTLTPSTKWREYEFKGKPTDVRRRPPQIAPYHLRLDWLMWFLPFRTTVTPQGIISYGYDPWFVHFMGKLLQGDKQTLKLLRHNPFPNEPPQHVRALFYRYRFTTSHERKETGAWWHRQLAGTYFPAVSFSDPAFRQILKQQGWQE